MSSISLKSEQIHSVVLNALASSSTGTIPDSRELKTTAQDGSEVTFREGSSQEALKASLDSLASRDVNQSSGWWFPGLRIDFALSSLDVDLREHYFDRLCPNPRRCRDRQPRLSRG